MLIIGCDYHPSFQQIACVDTDTGELSEHRLAHREEAEAVLPGAEAAESIGASGHGVQRTLALVRASVAGVAV